MMATRDWSSLLKRLSEDVLWQSEVEVRKGDDGIARLIEMRASLPSEAASSRWLGFPPASQAQIAKAEDRLGVSLPPSYREFLGVSNGWRSTGTFIDRIWSVEEIDWFRVRNAGWIEAYTSIETPFVPDERYFVYGAQQDSVDFREEYLERALEISENGDGSIYLLNPAVQTSDGEWEAWFFANWLPGATRYRSFWEMMVAEFHNVRALAQNGAI